jgi:chemotaxis-related protein WspD
MSDLVNGVSGVKDCWNRIGVRGDGSCAELVQHVHCRNCPVYARSAAHLLDAAIPDGYLETQAETYRQARREEGRVDESVVVFRLGEEWFALGTGCFQEVAKKRPVHPLPHRRNRVVQGVANVRGSLLTVISLPVLFGLPEGQGEPEPGVRRMSPPLALVLKDKGRGLVCPVDEVQGVRRFHAEQLRDVPATLAKTTASHARAAVMEEGATLCLLDEEQVFNSIYRSLA